MEAQVVQVFLILAVLQGLVVAQFNLPVFVAEAVLNEQQHPEKTVKVTDVVPAADTTSTPAAPLHPKIIAGLKSDENGIEGSKPVERVKREETFTKTKVDGVQRSYGRQADIDSFLTELEGDIARTQHTRKNAGSLNQSPSWSYKSPQTTEKYFWQRFGASVGTRYDKVKSSVGSSVGSTYDKVKSSVGSSVGSTYDQVKTKAKDIYKGFGF
ncbi:hypothetical protein GE061_013217 [Apolygus lucorum]|uniref:Uncharacterized protein n=1 Tax=Apolygus lucorum TaxID=248454 RepID=A0A8S9XWK5_APOLU|nr:hypothetical protein GE061_013217 [Apolygus lucorum]